MPIQGPWLFNGPQVKVEFLRQSKSNNITLVLHESARPHPSCWATMETTNIDEARESLRLRERTPNINNIGVWKIGENSPALITNLETWAGLHQIEAVIWTALPPKYMNKSHIVPTIEQIIDHFRTLKDEELKKAEEYVRKAPRQIATAYRERIEMDLGWTCLSEV